MTPPRPPVPHAAAAAWSAGWTSLSALAIVAGLDGAARGFDPARSAALACLVLGPPLIVLAAAIGFGDRTRAPAAGIAAGLVSFGLGCLVVELHDRWRILSGTPTGLLALLFILLAAALVFIALRRLLAALTDRIAPRTGTVVTAGAAILALSLVLFGSWPHAASPPPTGSGAGRPNVLLVTVDTLRADHLSTYGYGVHRTPHLDQIADEGLRFDSAYSTAPWTLPALGSLMTGAHPSVLGIDGNASRLPERPTLAASLAAAGYDTHAVVTNVFAERGFGLERGFRSYEHLHDVGLFDDLSAQPLYQVAQRVVMRFHSDHADRVVSRARDWLEHRRDPRRPFFLWLHFMDPHQPYGGAHVRDDLPCGGKEVDRFAEVFHHVLDVRRGRLTLTAAEREHVVHLYDANVRFLDRELGRLVDFLDRAGHRADTLLVVTADHGEEFWEHGGFTHGHTLHEEVTRIPLIVRWPDRLPSGGVRDVPVSLVDLMPTILGAAGVEAPVHQGVALSLGNPENGDRSVLSENIQAGPERKALRTRSLTVILDPASGSYETFRRSDDRRETRPLPDGAGAELAGELASRIEENRLAAAEHAGGTGERSGLTAFERERLRALGYVD